MSIGKVMVASAQLIEAESSFLDRRALTNLSREGMYGFIGLAFGVAFLVVIFMSAVIAFENLSSGMGTAAYAAFMASITNQKFTATQYALLTSLMGIPRVVVSAGSGFMAKAMGWEGYFIFCTLIALPGLLMLLRIRRSQTPRNTA